MNLERATRPATRPALRRLVLIAAFAAITSSAVGPAAHPAPASATTLSPTASSIETQLLSWVNNARAQRGLVSLRLRAGLVAMSGDRAAYMASTGVLAFPSCLSCMYTTYNVQKYNYGEIISWSSYNWGTEAAQSIWNGWRNSSSHWGKLMSSTFNYIGIGIAYRSANQSTWASADLTESKDVTNPWGKFGSGSVSGTTVAWSWTGADTRLQTHTAGLQNFDVQYRVDSGSWTTIRSGTTAKSLSLTGRAHGHWYGLRIRARDNLGHVSSYTAELHFWVP